MTGEGGDKLTIQRKFPWNLFLGFLARLGHQLEGEAGGDPGRHGLGPKPTPGPQAQGHAAFTLL